jgi:hypothetical protein
MDPRNYYRLVSGMGNSGEYWSVQVRAWWWPFWRTVDEFNYTIERAKERALNHATKHRHVRKVIDLGKLP